MSKWKLFLTLVLVLLAVPVMAQKQYGTGINFDVKYVAPGTLTLTAADSNAWKDVPSIDATNRWDGDWSGHPIPDLTTTVKLMWTNDTLYLYEEIQDYEAFYWGRADTSSPLGLDPSVGDQILVGLDATHTGDTTANDGSWSGWPWNAPGKGPISYKIWRDGITQNFAGANNVVDSGWARGHVFVDTVNFSWGVRAAFYVPGIKANSKIGFNIGGAQGSASWAKDNGGDGAYAWYSLGKVEYAGGDINHNAMSFSTLTMLGGTSDVEYVSNVLPTSYELSQNYPNPFNPSTTIRFALPRAGNVTLTVFNVLGQEVAVLVNGMAAAGQHQVVWNANTVGTGMYFYQMKVDGKPVETRKMLLMK